MSTSAVADICQVERTLQTRTLSTLKLLGFLGHTSTHAFATRRVMRSSKPYCLLLIVPCSRDQVHVTLACQVQHMCKDAPSGAVPPPSGP